MKVVLFQIGDVTIYSYGLMIAIGMIAAVGIGCLRAKKYGLVSDTMFMGAVVGIVMGVIGGKLMYWLVEIKSIIQNPSIMLNLGSGFVIYGGLLLGVLSPIFYFKKIKKTSALAYLDIGIASVALGQALGRVGCFMAGCCYGAEAPEGAWYAVYFPEGGYAPSGVGLYPTQLMSAIGDLIIMGVLMLLTNKAKFRGQMTSLYVILYSIGRFVLEFFRNDPRGEIGIFSTSQFISFFTLAGGIALYFILRKKHILPLRRLSSLDPAVLEEDAAPENGENREAESKETLSGEVPETENEETEDENV